MSHENSTKYEKLADLGEGIAVYKVHLDALREQDINARVMAKDKFERLTQNIEDGGRLEQLPFCTIKRRIDANTGEERIEFPIISGHHRTRAARKANLMEISVMVDENELSKSQIISKQIAHNALNGEDDKQVLARMFEDMDEIEDRISSGLSEQELDIKVEAVPVDEVKFDFSTETVSILFMKSGFKRFQEVLDALESDSHTYLAQLEDFNRFADLVRETSSRGNIRNIAGIMLKMMDVLEEHYSLTTSEDQDESWVSLSALFGTAKIPDNVAGKIRKQINEKGLDSSEKWKWFEDK